jgi:hypothetical protein
MITLTRRRNELLLASVALRVSARVEELSELSLAELASEVALVANMPDWTRRFRSDGLLRTICERVECHGCQLSWDGKDLRLSRRGAKVILRVPRQFIDYVDGAARTLPV